MSRISTSFMSEVLKRPVSIELVVPADHMVMPNGELPQKNRPYRTLYYLEGMCGDHRGPLDHTDLQLLAEDYNLAIVSIGGENKWYSASPFTDDDFISILGLFGCAIYLNGLFSITEISTRSAILCVVFAIAEESVMRNLTWVFDRRVELIDGLKRWLRG